MKSVKYNLFLYSLVEDMNIEIPSNLIRAMLTINGIVFVSSLALIGYQPKFVSSIFFFLYASIVSMVICFYVWFKEKTYQDEFNQQYHGHPDLEHAWYRTQYPEMLREFYRLNMICFGVIYFIALIGMAIGALF